MVYTRRPCTYRRGRKPAKRPTAYRKRRPYRTYKRRYAPIARINQVPDKLYVKLKYVDTSVINVAASSSTNWIFQSSLHDPFYGTGGHQPLYYDQYTTMFTKYRVFAFQYRVTVTAKTADVPLWLVVYKNGFASVDTVMSTAQERKGAAYRPFRGDNSAFIKGYCSVAQVLAVPRQDVNYDSLYEATVGSNPNRMAYMIAQVFNTSLAAVDVSITVQLKMYARFEYPYVVAQS